MHTVLHDKVPNSQQYDNKLASGTVHHLQV